MLNNIGALIGSWVVSRAILDGFCCQEEGRLWWRISYVNLSAYCSPPKNSYGYLIANTETGAVILLHSPGMLQCRAKYVWLCCVSIFSTGHCSQIWCNRAPPLARALRNGLLNCLPEEPSKC